MSGRYARAGYRRNNKKRDANEPEILEELRSIDGLTVVQLDRPVDLLIGYQGRTHLWEVKNPEGRDKMQDDQVEFIEGWAGSPVRVIRYRSEVRALLALDARAPGEPPP